MDTFTGTLSKGFVLAKPIAQENYKPEVLEQLERTGRLIITRKRDGWKMFAAIDADGTVRLYTDGMNEIDDRLAHIKEEVTKLRPPPCSLLVGECLIDLNDSDDLTKVISLFSLKDVGKALEHQNKVGKARFMVFSILFVGGQRFEMPCWGNLLVIRDCLEKADPQHVFCVPVLDMTLKQAKAKVVAEKWEGLVLYDRSYFPEIRLDGGSPKRTKGCYKWKPVLEDDFIVRRVNMRPDAKEAKELVLLQIDPKSRKEFECGKLGSLTGEMRRTFGALKKFPIVVQAEFESRFTKTGKIRSGKFVRVRDDKRAKDCIAPQSFPEADYA